MRATWLGGPLDGQAVDLPGWTEYVSVAVPAGPPEQDPDTPDGVRVPVEVRTMPLVIYDNKLFILWKEIEEQ